MFFKRYYTLPLCSTSAQKSNSGRHFLEVAQEELKEKGFGVQPDVPRGFILMVPFRTLLPPGAWFRFLLSGTPSQHESRLSAGLL